MIDRNKYLTEAMGGCNQDIGNYRDSGYLCCRKCKKIINGFNSDQCLGTNDFSTWQGFGKLWEWMQVHEGFKGLVVKWDTGDFPLGDIVHPDRVRLTPYIINPDRFANAVYEFLKGREI